MIYYTLDGSEPPHPTVSNTQALLSFRPQAVLERAYLDGYHPTDIDTQTYVFLADVIRQSPYGQAPSGWPASGANGQMMSYGMDPDIVGSFNSVSEVTNSLKAVSTMSIVTDLDNLFDASQGIYVNAGRKGINWERPASLELIHPDGSKDFRSTWACACVAVTAVRPEIPSIPFAFSFVELMGKAASSTRSSKTKAQIVLTSLISVPHKTTLGLSVGPTKTLWFVKFSRDTQGAMGWPYTRSRYYHIYLNGVYWGIFQTQERVGPNFCSDYLGVTPRTMMSLSRETTVTCLRVLEVS